MPRVLDYLQPRVRRLAGDALRNGVEIRTIVLTEEEERRRS